MGILDGRVAIITGAGRGIGAEVARLYVKEGAKVIINDLGGSGDGTGADAGPAKNMADELNSAAGETVAVSDAGDIAEVATGERLLQLAIDTFGKLDIVVNIAGILRDRMIFNMPAEDWDAVIRVHLRGHYSTVRPASAYWRELKNPEGNFRVINFSSTSGLHGAPGQPNYAAAKLGIVGLSMSLANGLARYGVSSFAVAPAAATRLVATIPTERGGGGLDEEVYSPANVAPMIAYLGSEASGYLTGRTVSVGGYKVGLYNNPEEIASVESEGPWDLADLAKKVETTFGAIAAKDREAVAARFAKQIK